MDDPKRIPPLPTAALAKPQPLAYARLPEARGFHRVAAIVAVALCVPFLAAPFLLDSPNGKLLFVCGVACPIAATILALVTRHSARRDRPARASATISLVIGSLELALVLGTVLLPGNPGSGHSETRRRNTCGSHLRHIGHALLMYSVEHQGRLPLTLDLLLTDGSADVDADVFVCPSTHQSVALGPTTASAAQAFRADPAHCSYAYHYSPLAFRALPPAYVLACEPLANHADAGMHVLFGDGHVEWTGAAPARHLLSELQSGHNPPRARPK